MYDCEPPALIVAVAGARTRWSIALTFTWSEAVPVPEGECVPVTVCRPTTLALQILAVQLPSGAMLKVVAPVTSPSSLLNAS